MKKLKFIAFAVALLLSSNSLEAQFKKKSKKNKFQCGYVHKKTLKEKLNVGAIVGKAVGKLFVQSAGNFSFDESAITIARGNHIYPKGFADWAFETPGWEACGTLITANSINKTGITIGSKLPYFAIDGKTYEEVIFGTNLQGFPHTDTSEKQVEIKDSDGKSFTVNLSPIKGFAIKTVNGVSRWDTSLTYDGEDDLVIELENEPNPDMKIGVMLHNKSGGVRFAKDVFFSIDKNTIKIPKEAFKNQMKFIKDNMLIVYKYKETILDSAVLGSGSVRILDTYYDFTPITIQGKLNESVMLKMQFNGRNLLDKSSNIDLKGKTSYNFKVNKDDPLYYHPSSEIEKITIPSFVVRANLRDETVSSNSYKSGNLRITNTTTITKWFPELSKDSWQQLANKLHDKFKETFSTYYGVEVVDTRNVVASKAYNNIFPISDTVTKNFVEIGAYGTQRIFPSVQLSTLAVTEMQNATIQPRFNTFPSDFLSSRVMKAFNSNCAISVNFDLNFSFTDETLIPVIEIKFLAPPMAAQGNIPNYYQTITAYHLQSIPLKDAKNLSGNTVDILYKMIHGDILISELKYALGQITSLEKQNPKYQIMYNAMFK